MADITGVVRKTYPPYPKTTSGKAQCQLPTEALGTWDS